MSAARIALLMSATMGCSAALIQPPGGKGVVSAYAPVNESSRRGTVRYLNQGASFVVSKRREDAYKKMYSSCGGSYRIDQEGPSAEGGMVTNLSNGNAVVTQSNYWYIHFACVPRVTASIQR